MSKSKLTAAFDSVELSTAWIPNGFHYRQVEANGVTLACAVGGFGPPLFVLHGWPQTGRAWRLVLQELAESYTVVGPDLRGAGNSSRPPAGYRKREQAEDMRALLKGLTLNEPVIVVGHDIGGMIAFAWAAAYPEEVSALVLMGLLVPNFGLEALINVANGGMFHFGLFMTPEVPELLFAGHELDFMQWWYGRMSGKPSALTPEDVMAYAEAYTGKDRLRGGFAQYRTLLDGGRDTSC